MNKWNTTGALSALVWCCDREFSISYGCSPRKMCVKIWWSRWSVYYVFLHFVVAVVKSVAIKTLLCQSFHPYVHSYTLLLIIIKVSSIHILSQCTDDMKLVSDINCGIWHLGPQLLWIELKTARLAIHNSTPPPKTHTQSHLGSITFPPRFADVQLSSQKVAHALCIITPNFV